MLLVFLAVNGSVTGLSATTPFFAMESVLIPFHTETQRTDLLFLMLNFVVSFLFLSVIMKKTEEQFGMNHYILTRTGKRKAIFLPMGRVYGTLACVVAAKLLADVTLGFPQGLENTDRLLWLTESTLLTVYLWTSLVYLMRLLHCPARLACLGLFVVAALAQYACSFFAPCTVLAMASPSVLARPLLWLGVKIGCTAAVNAVSFFVAKTYEQL